MKLMILDGNSVINRAFYGVRLLSTRDGQYTNAIYGFLNILQRMQAEERPDALCVAFDLHGPTFRHERYEAYKATRHGMPDELARQMPVMKEVLRAMRVPIYECQGWEADDVIGTVARICTERGWDCVIVTGDRDSLQLVNEHVRVKLVVTKGGQTGATLYDPETFRQEYGFEPIRLIDLKSLMGDSSDNIPGVAGVGPKTAAELLLKYGSLDGVYENLSPENMKGKLFEKLAAGKDSAYLSYDLATIRPNAPIDFSPEDALLAEPDKPALYALFLKLEFVKLIDRYGLRGAAQAPETAPSAAQPDAEDAPTAAAPDSLAAIEWPEPGTALAVCADAALDALAFDDGKTVTLLTREALGADCDAALRRLFSGAYRITAHGSKTLLRALLERGLPAFEPAFDTEVAAYLLDAARGKYELPRLALDYLKQEPESTLPALARTVRALEPVLKERLRENGMQSLLEEIDLPLCRVLAQMEQAGVLVDAKALADFGAMLKTRIDAAQSEI